MRATYRAKQEPQASKGKYDCEGGDDEKQQTENLFWRHGVFTSRDAEIITAVAVLVCDSRHIHYQK
jgi:hypothetical protein